MSMKANISMMENVIIAFFLLMVAKIIGLIRLTMKPEIPISGNKVPQVTRQAIVFTQDH